MGRPALLGALPLISVPPSLPALHDGGTDSNHPKEAPMTVNTALRDHVTSGVFSLSLRKTHIEALAYLDWRLTYDLSSDDFMQGADWRLMPSAFVSGTNGLIRRGLVEHRDPHGPGVNHADKPFSDFYSITTAGRLVIDLLHEAGLWQQYAGAYPTPRAEAVAA